MDVNAYLTTLWAWVLTSGLRIIFVLVLAGVALKVARIFSSRLVKLFSERHEDVEFQKRAETLGSVVRHMLTVIILITSTMIILKELGIEIGPILAAAGVVGLAVGFGAQSLVQDVISGFFILLEDQIRVGDVVQIAGQGGLVEKVNLRMTILRDVAGNVHYVRNGKIDLVTNMTKEFSRYVFDIGVAYREDVDEVISVIREVDEDMRRDPEYSADILEPMEILGLDKFADSAVVIRARTKTRPIQQWRVGREFNRRLKKRFDERGIEIPFPHVTMYMGQDKEGRAAPLNVSLKKGETS
ncbi:MAG: mechanosensitive ion channel family protein [Nitrospiraceae bacterium]|nr:MAG: mechanosensitive ion channel family protein [Nitrospiraceae bacterium]